MNDVILLCSKDDSKLKDIKLDECFDFKFKIYPTIIDKDNEVKSVIEYVHENQNKGNGFTIIKEKYEHKEILYIADVLYNYNDRSDTWAIGEINNINYKILFKQILNYLNRVE